MTQTLKAIFDGKVFIPLESVDLKPGTEVSLQVRLLPKRGQRKPRD
jgi:predicted DNA-binding antitoxin AbrB/MazE fold protein